MFAAANVDNEDDGYDRTLIDEMDEDDYDDLPEHIKERFDAERLDTKRERIKRETEEKMEKQKLAELERAENELKKLEELKKRGKKGGLAGKKGAPLASEWTNYVVFNE